MVGGGSVCSDWGVLALVMVFREVMLTSPPELAHCGGVPVWLPQWPQCYPASKERVDDTGREPCLFWRRNRGLEEDDDVHEGL